MMSVFSMGNMGLSLVKEGNDMAAVLDRESKVKFDKMGPPRNSARE